MAMNARSRRQFLQGLALGAVALNVPGLCLAGAPNRKKTILVILRGGMDGLGAVPPVGDPWLHKQRSALVAPEVLPLDRGFGLHPGLAFTAEKFAAKQAIVCHAVATPYRSRSHFAAQDCLENGSGSADGARDGWLGRLLQARRDEQAIAMMTTVPLICAGRPDGVSNWSVSGLRDPRDALLERLSDLYADDPQLASSFAEAMELDRLMGDDDRPQGRSRNALHAACEVAARTLRLEGGPSIAVLEDTGWDTHARQGAGQGRLARQLQRLDAGLRLLAEHLGPVWSDTVVMVVSEFGRTVATNGTGGTDHGTGSAALLLGGALKGGQIIADWPGLAPEALYQGRDLRPTMDLRSIFAGVLRDHLKLDARLIRQQVFVDAQRLPIQDQLIA